MIGIYKIKLYVDYINIVTIFVYFVTFLCSSVFDDKCRSFSNFVFNYDIFSYFENGRNFAK